MKISRRILQAGFGLLSSLLIGLPAMAEVVEQQSALRVGNVDLPVYSWRDSTRKPKAILIGLHGSVQNATYLSQLGKELSRYGFVTYAPDFRGHGRWLDAPNATDEHTAIDYGVSESDVSALARALRENYPGVPLFAVGESIGAAVAIKVASEEKNVFDGMILASPGSKPALKDVATIGRIVLGGIASGGTSIDLSEHIGENISDDPRTRADLINDPKVHKTSNLGKLLHAAFYIKKAAKAAKELPDMPVLVMQGEEDRILNPKSAKDLFEKLEMSDKQLKLIPDCGHIVVTGNFLKPQVIKVVSDWIDARATVVVANKLLSQAPKK